MAERQWIEIPNWATLQHYKRSHPAWIKLYRTATSEDAIALLTDSRYRRLPASAQALLIDLWLLAAESGGRVPYEPQELEFRLHRLRTEIVQNVERLAASGLIRLSGDDSQLTLENTSRGPLESRSIGRLEDRSRGGLFTEEKRREEKRREDPPQDSIHHPLKRIVGEVNP